MSVKLLRRAWVLAVLAVFHASLASASKPKDIFDLSQEACDAVAQSSLLAEKPRSASSSLVSPREFCIGTRCDFLAWIKAVKGTAGKASADQGQLVMYSLAEQGAIEIVEREGFKDGVRVRRDGDWLDAAEETYKLIQAKTPVILGPVLVAQSGQLSFPSVLKLGDDGLYEPIHVYGHQEKSRDDELLVARSGLALAEYQDGRLSKTGWIYLVPMVEKQPNKFAAATRSASLPADAPAPPPSASQDISKLDVVIDDFVEIVRGQERKFIQATNEGIADRRAGTLERAPERCADCAGCPFKKTCGEIIAKNFDYSLVPFPPAPKVRDRLKELGHADLQDFAKLELNSPQFREVPMRSGLKMLAAYDLLAKAIATVEGKPIVKISYENPFINPKTGKSYSRVVHIDFEDLLDRKVKAQVYLYGAMVEGKMGDIRREEFIFSDSLEGPDMEEALARFLRFMVEVARETKGDFIVTTYSPHEYIKIRQALGIIEVPYDPEATKQDAATRRLLEHANSTVLRRRTSGFDGKVRERDVILHITNRRFLEKYPDLTARKIFNSLLVRPRSQEPLMLDLLPFIRNNFAMGGNSNGLKSILDKIRPEGATEAYLAGDGGLNAMHWILMAFRTHEEDLFQLVKDYNWKDVYFLTWVRLFIEAHAGERVHPRLRLNLRGADGRIMEMEQVLAYMRAADATTSRRERVIRLRELAEVLEVAMGRSVTSLSKAQFTDLVTILDRKKYLKRRGELEGLRAFRDRETQEAWVRANQQHARHSYEGERRSQLQEFLGEFNAGARSAKKAVQVQEAIAAILSRPAHQLREGTLRDLRALAWIETRVDAEGLRAGAGRQIEDFESAEDFELPARWRALLNEFQALGMAEHYGISDERLADLLSGLYWLRAFPDPDAPRD